jgi:hypothetical protein
MVCFTHEHRIRIGFRVQGDGRDGSAVLCVVLGDGIYEANGWFAAIDNGDPLKLDYRSLLP